VSKRLKMKDLERATGIGREAIRYYIREGLLPEPERPGRNVAWYDDSFVDRILLIKKLQHERFLPLSIIKGVVAGDVAPSDAEVRTLVELDGKLTGSTSGNARPESEKLSSLCKRLALSVAEVRTFADCGAVDLVTRDGNQWIEGRDVSILELWSRFRNAGFTAELGFGPEDVRTYVDFCQWLVREELRIFAGRVTGKVDAQTAQHMAERGLALTAEMLALIHERTLLQAIARGNLPAEDARPGPRDRVGNE